VNAVPVLPLDLIVAATGAAIARGGASSFTGVSQDGRAVPKGGLYFAIRGERLDGHDFVAQAEQVGAAGVVVARGRGAQATAATKQLAVFEVDEPVLALGRLARAYRRTLTVKVLALTGSVGKTSTKELLAGVLAAAVGEAAVHKTRGNLNNHLGVPLTLLGMEASHRYAVVEMGMSSLGEIAYLEQLAWPDLALVTRVDGVHLEQLGSIENVGRAKGEVFEGRAAAGVAYAIAPFGEQLLAPALAGVPRAMQRSFGGAGADVIVRSAHIDGDATQIVLGAGSQTISARLQLLGAHHAYNAAAATAAALALGLDTATIARGLESVRPEKHRMQLLHIEGRLIVDDCYNASPPSMRAALDATAALGAAGARRLAILGDMRELGPSGPEAHLALGRYAAERVDTLIGLGELGEKIAAGARETLGAHAVAASSIDDAAARARTASRAGDVVLIKASRGMKLERVLDALTKLSQSEAG
jgi:UDP-N-acetylmuramoyl-tripeptide--D-alanyl-D-alanine ligase